MLRMQIVVGREGMADRIELGQMRYKAQAGAETFRQK